MPYKTQSQISEYNSGSFNLELFREAAYHYESLSVLMDQDVLTCKFNTRDHAVDFVKHVKSFPTIYGVSAYLVIP